MKLFINNGNFMIITTRNEAKYFKFPVYYTGKECCNGHIALRYTSSAQCMECVKSAMKMQRKVWKIQGKKLDASGMPK